MNLLSSLLTYTARQIAALISKDSSQDTEIDGAKGRLTTAESNISTLTSRIETAISAVTTDTEVTDIRVGDDGVTYNTAGTAVRTQLSNVKSEINDVYDGDGFFRNLTLGSLDASGELISTNQNWVSSADWFISKYPLRITIADSAYSGRMYFDDNGTVSYSNILTNGDVLYPNRKTKISFWKTNSYTALNLEEAKHKIKVQIIDDYLAQYAKMSLDKSNSGYALFSGYIRRGTIGSSNGIYVDYVSYRCATPFVNRYAKDLHIIAENGFRFAIQTFNDSDVFVSDLGWKTDYIVSANQGFKLVIARSTDNTSEYANVDEFLQGIKVVSIFATKDEIDNISLPMLGRGFLMNGGKPHLVAHTGYTANYPENSVPAFSDAGNKGFWGIESDVQQTSDGKFVMIHDSSVDRTTDGSGNVNEMTLAQIRALHITGTSYQVPTLEEFLGICKRYGCVPVIEIKSTVSASGIISIVELIKNFGLYDTCILIGSKWNLSNVRVATDSIPYLSICQAGLGLDFDTELAFANASPNTGLDWDFNLSVDLTKAKKLHDKDMLFGTFTIDDADDVMTAFMAGVDFVTTNSVLPTN